VLDDAVLTRWDRVDNLLVVDVRIRPQLGRTVSSGSSVSIFNISRTFS
jgi:hypothetical protein